MFRVNLDDVWQYRWLLLAAKNRLAISKLEVSVCSRIIETSSIKDNKKTFLKLSRCSA